MGYGPIFWEGFCLFILSLYFLISPFFRFWKIKAYRFYCVWVLLLIVVYCTLDLGITTNILLLIPAIIARFLGISPDEPLKPNIPIFRTIKEEEDYIAQRLAEKNPPDPFEKLPPDKIDDLPPDA